MSLNYRNNSTYNYRSTGGEPQPGMRPIHKLQRFIMWTVWILIGVVSILALIAYIIGRSIRSSLDEIEGIDRAKLDAEEKAKKDAEKQAEKDAEEPKK